MFKEYDGLFIANIANENVRQIAMDKKNRLTENLFLFDVIDIFSLKIPIVLTASSPDISNPVEYKKAVNGLRDVFRITPTKRMTPIGFGASMKRPGIKHRGLFPDNFLTIGDNLTVAAMIESIKNKISEMNINKYNDDISILVTGPTGFIGGELMSWVLENTKWKVIAISTNKDRFELKYNSNSYFSRIKCLTSFEELSGHSIDIVILATHYTQSIPPLNILSNMPKGSVVFDVCTPNIYSLNDLVGFRGVYCSSISVKVDNMIWMLGNYSSVGHDYNTIWPCLCELALVIKNGFENFSRCELLNVSECNVNKIHSMALSNNITYKFNIET